MPPGRQSLILMPEIALTGAIPRPLCCTLWNAPGGMAFGAFAVQTRAHMARGCGWRCRCRGRRALGVVLPYADLGLIVVDEEHDRPQQQQDGVHDHARDMAVVRVQIAHIPVVLSSATPSLETEVNVRRGRYRRLALPERFGGQRMPSVEAIDLRRERPPPGRLHRADARRRGEDGDRARRAGAVVPARRRAADICAAPAASASPARIATPGGRSPLSQTGPLCHHRGFAMPHPAECPKCSAANSFVAIGPGVERLEEEVRELFPQARLLVLSSDLVATVERLREEPTTSPPAARHRHRHPACRQGSSFPEAQRPRSASSMPISARSTAICAPPSARSSFCIRWSGAPAAMPCRLRRFLQTHQPSIR